MQRALEGLEGVESVEMRFDENEFDIAHDTSVTPKALMEAVAAAGFKSSLVPGTPPERE